MNVQKINNIRNKLCIKRLVFLAKYFKKLNTTEIPNFMLSDGSGQLELFAISIFLKEMTA